MKIRPLAFLAAASLLSVAGCKKSEDSAPADHAEASVTPAGELPAECADYKAAIEKFATCDKFPQATRDALRASFDQMAESWANPANMTPEAKLATKTSCKSAAAAVTQATAACN